jgi:hypothetical protein
MPVRDDARRRRRDETSRGMLTMTMAMGVTMERRANERLTRVRAMMDGG